MASRRRVAGSTKEGYTESVDLFTELLGGKDRLLHEISDVEILEYAEALALVPLRDQAVVL
jgi:hypothetical protein